MEHSVPVDRVLDVVVGLRRRRHHRRRRRCRRLALHLASAGAAVLFRDTPKDLDDYRLLCRAKRLDGVLMR